MHRGWGVTPALCIFVVQFWTPRGRVLCISGPLGGAFCALLQEAEAAHGVGGYIEHEQIYNSVKVLNFE